MAQPTQDYYLEATYQDGFVLKGTRSDVSSFVEGKNQFYDVIEGLHEKEHGKLVNWAVVGTAGTRYDLDMTHLPDNARPIFYREMERDLVVDNDGNIISEGTLRVMRTIFGAQWNDETGQNHQLKEELE